MPAAPTDIPVAAPDHAEATQDEVDYLCRAVNRYLERPVAPHAVLWRYAGVRPLYDDGSSDPSAVTRDYTLRLDAAPDEAPVLSVFGGKITTYRRLAEHALEKLAPYFPRLPGAWTGRTPLPGSDFKDREEARKELLARHRDLPPEVLQGVFRRHGARALQVLGDALLCDIDDTLTTEGKLTAQAYDALERLRRAGKITVPVTGRPAGWCDHIARMWPVDAVVGENGAFYFFYAGGRLQRRFQDDAETR